MARSKRLFIDATPLLDYRLSGIGHTVLSMVKAMSESTLYANYNIYLVAPYLKCNQLRRFRFKNIRIISIPLPARVWNAWPQFIFMPPVDLFLGRGTYIFMNYKKWPLLFSKSITYVYDANYAMYPAYVEPRNLRMLQHNLPRWMSHSDTLVTISESSKYDLITYAHAPLDKLRVIYCGVDKETMHSAGAKAVTAVRRRYGIEKKYLMFLSNVEPRKNIENLLKALRLLPPEYKKTYSLVIVGGMSWSEGQIIDEIEKTKKDGWSIIKPSRYVPDEDLPALLSGAELLVHPAFHEGFGISPLQALACGTPVAVSDIPVMHETVGEAGEYFDPNDPQSIANTLHGIISHKQLVVSKQAMLQRAAKFSWDRAARSLYKLIGEL